MQNSLLCHKANNGKSYCCQIVPGLKLKALNSIKTKKIHDNMTPSFNKLKKEEKFNKQNSKLFLKPSLNDENNIIKKTQIGQAPAVRPDDENILLNYKENLNKSKSDFEQSNNNHGLFKNFFYFINNN